MGPYVVKGCLSTPSLDREPVSVAPHLFSGSKAYVLPRIVPPSLPNPLMKVLGWHQLSHQRMEGELDMGHLDEWFWEPFSEKKGQKGVMSGLDSISNALETLSQETRNPRRGLVLCIERYLTIVVENLLCGRNDSELVEKWSFLVEYGNKLLRISAGGDGQGPGIAHLCGLVHVLNGLVCQHLSKTGRYAHWDKLAKEHISAGEDLFPLMELVEMYPVFWNNQLQRGDTRPQKGQLVLPGRAESQLSEHDRASPTSWWTVGQLRNLPRGRAYVLPLGLHNQDLCSGVNAVAWLLFDIVREHGCGVRPEELVFLL